MQSPPRPAVAPTGGSSGDPLCEVSMRKHGNGHVLEVRGELGALTLPAFETQIDQVLCAREPETVLDVRHVSVLDCAGCSAIAGLAHDLSRRGGTLVIRTAPGAIRGLLISTGLAECLAEARAA